MHTHTSSFGIPPCIYYSPLGKWAGVVNKILQNKMLAQTPGSCSTYKKWLVNTPANETEQEAPGTKQLIEQGKFS